MHEACRPLGPFDSYQIVADAMRLPIDLSSASPAPIRAEDKLGNGGPPHPPAAPLRYKIQGGVAEAAEKKACL